MPATGSGRDATLGDLVTESAVRQRTQSPVRTGTRSLKRLQHRLTGWYIATFAAILSTLGAGLFLVTARQIGAALDRSLQHAVAEVIRGLNAEVPTSGELVSVGVREMRSLRIPDRALYLFDGTGRLLSPDSASPWVRAAALRAGRAGRATLQADIGGEHTLRVYAERYEPRSGAVLVVAASADTEELEDQYAALIASFAGAALAALALVAVGGALLARKSTLPVEQNFEYMRRFMADAAHELRTPVAVIRAQADVALEHPMTDPHACASALEGVSREATRLGGIVDDLLTLARAESGERELVRERVYLDDLALDAATAARAIAHQRGVRLDVTDFEEASVVGDPALLRQLLMIVLDNAIKYTRSGGRVTIGVSAADGAPVVLVEDTGVGISAEALPRIFDRFYRGGSARDPVSGAGLGLAIARWITDAHEGDIAVSSAPGRGTRVRLRFPRAPR